MSKECGECTVCCSGTLDAVIFEHTITKGVSCPFVSKSGCTIHSERPNVCRSFICGWLAHPNIPEYMRPDKSGVILISSKINNASILSAIEYDQVTEKAVDWLDRVEQAVDYKFIKTIL